MGVLTGRLIKFEFTNAVLRYLKSLWSSVVHRIGHPIPAQGPDESWLTATAYYSLSQGRQL